MTLNADLIRKNLTEQTKNSVQIRVVESIPSTNDQLLSEAKVTPEKITALFAEAQTQGRGRLGRAWISPANKNLYFSLSWYFQKPIGEIMGLSVSVGKCLAIALNNYGITQPITVKYPNDLMHNHKKLGGILIETIPNPSHCIAIIGIGVNVNMSAEEINTIDQPWTSLLQITNTPHDRNRLASYLLNALYELLTQWSA